MQGGRTAPEAGAWGREGTDLLRGLTGGFLVGVPLIYTMETWWIGETISMPHAVGFLIAAYVLNLGCIAFAGFRRSNGGGRLLTDALEATSLAALAAAVTLALLHQLGPGQPLGVVLGRIAVDTLPVSLGVSVANHILSPRESRTGEEDDAPSPKDPPSAWRALVLDLGAAAVGALFVCLQIAPTDEVPMLATEVPALSLPVLILFSLLLSYAIVFVAGFGDERARRESPGVFQRPLPETVVAYVVSLVTCGAVLWLFGQIDPATDGGVVFAEIVILGLPATIGGAAGRLAL